MKSQGGFRFGAVLLLLAVLDSALPEDEDKTFYFVVGGSLTLDPGPAGSESITSILWKHKGNLLAEWVKNEVSLTFYRQFNGRAALNTDTGRLDVKNITQGDSGLFTVEINNKVQGRRYNAKVIENVPTPSARTRPLVCSPAHDNCTLFCDGETAGAEPIIYSWRKGEGTWEISTKEVPFLKNETAHVKTFSCRMQNPVSVKDSEPIANPFFKEEPSDGTTVGAAVGVPLAIILVGGLVFAVFKRNSIKEWYYKCRGRHPNGSPSGNGQPPPGGQPPSDGKPPPGGNSSEMVSLMAVTSETT
ncbi:SLAM family member 9-like [Chelmon rostratus]|uniref:SLAM family member 9-like n=1 Tax=Chelmon rostratus TaxID=109905 RepID=UPI001BE8C3D6|nr:SLAM family member 9-like [Chelmon rostratus]